jgi:hypothetical protein
MHGEAKRNLEFIGGNQDRQLQQLWAKTKIGDILPWEDGCRRVFVTNVKGTFFGMSESEEASKRR